MNNNTYDRMERIKELLGTDMLLQELAQALSDKELNECLEHIETMHDIAEDNEEDDE